MAERNQTLHDLQGILEDIFFYCLDKWPKLTEGRKGTHKNQITSYQLISEIFHINFEFIMEKMLS